MGAFFNTLVPQETLEGDSCIHPCNQYRKSLGEIGSWDGSVTFCQLLKLDVTKVLEKV